MQPRWAGDFPGGKMGRKSLEDLNVEFGSAGYMLDVIPASFKNKYMAPHTGFS